MSLNVNIAVQVNMMDGSNLITVFDGETSVNPNPQDVAAEVLLVKGRLREMMERALERSQERLDEFGEALDKTIQKEES